ncbi:HK97 family phage prohead protease [Pusillimonas sp. ANT_WB101]|uniref:HK97 family phage prohead protease n=1 Tax=Pusillimonas sp. ANT_WB101 TaxID=2597356 RepID=UPI0011EE3238|nr:HK97 family phage prohead protease [Pusillimonas sp. ANT_WB101]KAA0893069.1 HK97 family phage prohead protease [Pusillimonas sp. ANT_WB101]
MLELRSGGTLATNGKTLSGYAAVFNSEAPIGDFAEVIRAGAFTKSLQSGSNIRALYHHDASALLGTTKGGTLELREDAKGLAFSLKLPDTSHGRDLAILVDRGDVAGCSFGFRVRDGGDKWEQRGTTLIRELLDLDLQEITLTSDPAYADTTVALRSKPSVYETRGLRVLWMDTL